MNELFHLVRSLLHFLYTVIFFVFSDFSLGGMTHSFLDSFIPLYTLYIHIFIHSFNYSLYIVTCLVFEWRSGRCVDGVCYTAGVWTFPVSPSGRGPKPPAGGQEVRTDQGRASVFSLTFLCREMQTLQTHLNRPLIYLHLWSNDDDTLPIVWSLLTSHRFVIQYNNHVAQLDLVVWNSRTMLFIITTY